jgi:hypothetical protein
MIQPRSGRTGRAVGTRSGNVDVLLNCDMVIDVAVGSTNGVEVLFGNGDGSFTVNGHSLNHNNISSLATADFNRSARRLTGRSSGQRPVHG